MKWTDEEIRILYDNMTLAELSIHTGIKERNLRYRLHDRKIIKEPAWTPEDIQYVLDHYSDQTAEVIGKHLNRSAKAIRGIAFRNGSRKKLNKSWDTRNDPDLLRLHSENMSYREIAASLNLTYHSVKHRAQTMGLQPHCGVKGVKVPQRISDKTVQALKEAGFVLGRARSQVYREYVNMRGWDSSEVTVRQAQILDYLCVHGTATKKQLALFVYGKYFDGSFNKSGLSYLTDLVTKNYLVKLRGNHRSTQTIFILGPKALDNLNRRNHEAQQHESTGDQEDP